MDPLIISCAVTGDLPVADFPTLPATPEAVGQSAVEAAREGASIVHLHARDDSGEPTGDVEYFKRAVDVIRSSDTDVLINLTTSYGGSDDNVWEKRFEPLALNPDLASFDCGTLNFGEAVFNNSIQFLRELAARMEKAGVKPELEIFDSGMIGTVAQLVSSGALQRPLWHQFVLGIQGGAPAVESELLQLRSLLPPGEPWSVCAAGRHQLPMNTLAIVLGGHTRTGLEDNQYFRKGDLADNPRLVDRVRKLAEMLERPVATPDQARDILGLRAREGVAA